ncbi:hypothetical protein HMPREF0476_1018 [Kingella kingae ATCC 23330]|uniref:Uncharacterized protein n=1 Tax=Kingella kingae ATCC 23330 TaxID=887327 RepID=F5S735_KINKI|nr:hypothetical protein HMPREF0476_1018 [Kingella kingae ATCC 23330]
MRAGDYSAIYRDFELYSNMKSQRYCVANALVCYLHMVSIVALSRFYFISL